MHIHIVFAHPSHDSFTGDILASFISGLSEVGYTCSVSDLYEMGFGPILGIQQYSRESGQAPDLAVHDQWVA